jgi:hypothetical protein
MTMYDEEIDPAEWDAYETNRTAEDAERNADDQAQYEAWLEMQSAEMQYEEHKALYSQQEVDDDE